MSSVTTTADTSGNLAQESVARVYPFGLDRQMAGTRPTVSDRGYTGHRHNDDPGLVYMNARYYLSSLGQFASADTIVPQPGNPQAFGRYAYVYNDPVNLIDPTGHCVEQYEAGSDEWNACFDALYALTDYYNGLGLMPNEFLSWVMVNATTEEIVEMLVGFGVDYEYDANLPASRSSRSIDDIFDLEFLESHAGYVDTLFDLWEVAGFDTYTGATVPGTWLIPGLAQGIHDFDEGLFPEERLLRIAVVVGEGAVVDALSIQAARELGGQVAMATWELSPIIMVPATVTTMGATYFGIQFAGDAVSTWANDNVIFPAIRSASSNTRLAIDRMWNGGY